MSDQETGSPPPDPNEPAQSSETAVPQEEGQQSDIKSPDETNEAREGGGYDKDAEDDDES